MNRRAKLTLAASRDIPKKQAPAGFEGLGASPEASRGRPTPAPRPAPRPVATDNPVKNESRATAHTKAATASSTSFRPGKLIKVVVVVVATALTLYLLKRRFF